MAMLKPEDIAKAESFIDRIREEMDSVEEPTPIMVAICAMSSSIAAFAFNTAMRNGNMDLFITHVQLIQEMNHTRAMRDFNAGQDAMLPNSGNLN